MYYKLDFIDELLITSSVGKILFSKLVTGFLLSINWMSNSAATFPISNAGCRMVVSEGLNSSGELKLQNPAIAI